MYNPSSSLTRDYLVLDGEDCFLEVLQAAVGADHDLKVARFYDVV